MDECTIEKLGFGCVSLTTHTFLRDAISILKTAYDVGIRHFDTAPSYGRGYSEEILGCFLGSNSSMNAKVTVTTKFAKSCQRKLFPTQLVLLANGLKRSLKELKLRLSNSDSQFKAALDSLTQHSVPEGGARDETLISKEEVEKSLMASRRAIRRDFIDYFLLHEARPSSLTREAFDWLCKMRDDGRIGKIGVAANYQIISQLSELEVDGWDVLQYEFVPEVSSAIAARFPNKTHMIHSCMRWLNTSFAIQYRIESASDLFNYIVNEIPCRHLLFATRDETRLRANVVGLKKK